MKEALIQLGIKAEIKKLTDFRDIAAYGVMQTPALVVNEQVKVMGRVAAVDEIKKYIS